MWCCWRHGDGGEVDELIPGQLLNHKVQVLFGEGDGALTDFVHAHHKGEGDRTVQNASGLENVKDVLYGGGFKALQFRLCLLYTSLGKDEVGSSNLPSSSMKTALFV